ncbi:putative acetyltransferase [Rhodovulum iodosum]|uniref:Acetyltransferase n=2 Tax=Rhodovulum iodosum TaxID=68291 RepID=A0ABV3XSS2_9RHOB
MAMNIRTEPPLSADGRRLVERSEAALLAVYPPEECFSFTAEELAEKGTQFLVARNDGEAIGCIALVDQGAYGEIKRLYVAETARGSGVARALIEAAEAAARDIGLGLLKLETGHALHEAVSLYRAMGYRETEAFGGYPDITSNLFMEKEIGVRVRLSG